MGFQKKIKLPNGVLEDPRTEEERKADYKTEEVLTKAPVIYYKNYEEGLRTSSAEGMNLLEIHDQDGSSSCVANACAILTTILNVAEEQVAISFSPRGMYPKRMNRPSEGMFFNDAAQLLVDNGMLIERLAPSYQMNEAQMNNIPEDKIASFKTIAKLYAPSAYFWLDNDIHSFATVLETGKPILLGVRFGDGEGNKDVPTINSDTTKYAHAICAIPKAYFSYKGQPAILIVDSGGVNNGMKGYRILTKEWFDKGRVFAGLGFTDLPNPTVTDKVKATFNNDLVYGNTGEEVFKLQTVLKDKYGLFKMNPTGNYYGYTMACVKALQKLKGIEETGNFGPKTRAAVNKDLK